MKQPVDRLGIKWGKLRDCVWSWS